MVDNAPTSPTAAEVGTLWMNYFEDHFYPYRQDWEKWEKTGSVEAYHVMHYADFAASVQQTLQNIGYDLAVRLKKLTGQKNLVLSGGCALNCSMNAVLSEKNSLKICMYFPPRMMLAVVSVRPWLSRIYSIRLPYRHRIRQFRLACRVLLLDELMALFLAGGPGGSQMVAERRALAGLEDHFVVVNWDQPGAGKSFDAIDRSNLRIGWYFGTKRFESEGEFFLATIDDAIYR